jgi:hypothetical protein
MPAICCAFLHVLQRLPSTRQGFTNESGIRSCQGYEPITMPILFSAWCRFHVEGSPVCNRPCKTEGERREHCYYPWYMVLGVGVIEQKHVVISPG